VTNTYLLVTGNNAVVAEGYNLTVQAGQSLEHILKTAREVNDQIDQISVNAQRGQYLYQRYGQGY
jgi:methyl-accepting chemotaxis protein